MSCIHALRQQLESQDLLQIYTLKQGEGTKGQKSSTSTPFKISKAHHDTFLTVYLS